MIRTLFYFGHHKCATKWINSILISVCRDMGWSFTNFHNPKLFDFDLEEVIRKRQLDFIAYTGANFEYVAKLQMEYKGFHVIRDPRDIIVSSYFSSLISHPTNRWPELIPHRQKLNQVTKDEGLLLEMDFIRDVIESLATWNYGCPNILELRFEDVVVSPYQSFLDIFQYLGCLDTENWSVQKNMTYLLSSLIRRKMGIFPKGTHILAEPLLGKVYENQFSKKSAGRNQGTEDITSHYRKGLAGDWVNHFTNEHRSYFKKNYGDLVVKLGYEQNNDW
jgi:hypothetical protein